MVLGSNLHTLFNDSNDEVMILSLSKDEKSSVSARGI